MDIKAVLGALFLLAFTAASASAISLCEYTKPVTAVTTFTLQGSFRYLDDEFRNDQGNVMAVSLAGDFLRLYDSADFGYSLGGAATLSTAGGPWSLIGTASLDFRFYAPGADLFAFGQVHSLWAELTPTAAVVMGAGYGRFRDVTPLAKAMRISQELVAEKAIVKELPDTTLMAIATEIGRREEYANLEELVPKIAGLVETSGVVVGKLNAVAILRIREVLEAIGDQRLCGFAVRAGIGHELLDPAGVLDFVLFGSGDYALPISLDTQIHLRAEGSATPGFTAYTLGAVASLVHRLSPTATLTGRLTLSRALPAGGTPADSQALDANLQFALARGWTVNVTFGVRHRSGFEEPRIDLTVSAGLSGF